MSKRNVKYRACGGTRIWMNSTHLKGMTVQGLLQPSTSVFCVPTTPPGAGG